MVKIKVRYSVKVYIMEQNATWGEIMCTFESRLLCRCPKSIKMYCTARSVVSARACAIAGMTVLLSQYATWKSLLWCVDDAACFTWSQMRNVVYVE